MANKWSPKGSFLLNDIFKGKFARFIIVWATFMSMTLKKLFEATKCALAKIYKHFNIINIFWFSNLFHRNKMKIISNVGWPFL